MPEKEMNHQPGNEHRFRIEANAGETPVDIILPVQLPKNRQPGQYKIVKKDIPQEAIGKMYGGKTVIWINNYGIRLRGRFPVKAGGQKQDPFIDEVADEQFEYEVLVPGPAPEGYPTLVYFYDNTVLPANATYNDTDRFYHFKLNIGDPADGWGG